MTDLAARLRIAVADRYRVEEELGAGGMAVVFRAHDLRHDRVVALKVLRPELAMAVGTERFLREIQIAGRLNHPHILALYDSGEADGLVFYVMPFVDGETLRDRLARDRRLAIDEALRIVRDVADALKYAHDHDVVHRDIKPENILLASGHAVVADFGIARAISMAGGEQLTQTGIAVGTPAYMSPEQAVGDAHIDGRSDLYSLGIVFYEAVVGTPPFAAPTPQAAIAKRLTELAPRLSEIVETTPPAVDTAIARVLSRMPADRFANAAEFAGALIPSGPIGDLARSADQSGPGRARGFPWRWALATAVVASLTFGAVWFVRGGEDATLPSVAVLPFDNVGAAENEYFADGVTEEMTSRLAEISGLRVTSRTSAAQYKATVKSVREIGRELRVEYVLEGTVRTDRGLDGSGQVRVTPRLIRVSDESSIWTGRYDANLAPGEIFAVQGEIAEQVARALDVALVAGERAVLQEAPTTDREAYNAYLLGRFHWNRRTPQGLQRAVDFFDDAIRRDSSFAAAWAGQADALVLLPFYNVAGMSSREAFERAKFAARQAIRLAPDLAEAHASLAEALLYNDRDWSGAEREFLRAIELDPTYPVAHYWYAELLVITNRLTEAIVHSERAVALAPAAPITHQLLGQHLTMVGDWSRAEQQFRQALELQPDLLWSHLFLALVHLHRGTWDGARAELIRTGLPPNVAQAIVTARRDPARAPESVRVIDAYLRGSTDHLFSSPERNFYGLADIVDSTVAWIVHGIEAGSGVDLLHMQNPITGRAANDPRIRELRRALGLPE